MFKILLLTILVVAINANAAQVQRDPTKPLSGVAGAQSSRIESFELVLQSIIKKQSGQERKAIISGRLVQEGEQVLNYQVVRIDDNAVVIQSPDDKRTLTLFSQAIVNDK